MFLINSSIFSRFPVNFFGFFLHHIKKIPYYWDRFAFGENAVLLEPNQEDKKKQDASPDDSGIFILRSMLYGFTAAHYYRHGIRIALREDME